MRQKCHLVPSQGGVRSRQRIDSVEKVRSKLSMQLGEALARIEQLEKQLAAMMVRLEISERRAEQYRSENERLRLRVADLEMRVRFDSASSHKPPSSDPPCKTRHASKERTGQKAGARRGHKGMLAYLAGSQRLSWRSIQTRMQDVFRLASRLDQHIGALFAQHL